MNIFICYVCLLCYIIDSYEESIKNKYKLSEKQKNLRQIKDGGFFPSIVGGFEVNINRHPYQAAYGNNCAATIIDKNWAITAGHCQFQDVSSYIKVGTKYRVGGGKQVPIKKLHVHPRYKQNNTHKVDFDFALIELNESLKFNWLVKPVKVARPQDVVTGKMLTVTGWGYTDEKGNQTDVLQAISVPIIDQKICQKVPYPLYQGTLTPRMLCAGYREGKKDACQGDSGGPAVAGDRLIGITSFGYGCAKPDTYGVYSNVAAVRDWIEDVTKLKLD